MANKFDSKKILVVGTTSGIGYTVTQQLLQQGCQVVSIARRPSPFNVEQHLLMDVLQMKGDELSHLEKLDGLVYCPGSIQLKPINRLSIDDFLSDWRINVGGAIQIIQASLKALRNASQASIVLYSTVAVQTGLPFHASVAAAKGAIEGLTRTLAAELAPKIRVNAIAPSLTDTPLAKNLLSSDEKRENSAKRHPLGRIGLPQDIAQATLFLLSEESSWITGQILAVDGGISSIRLL
ncbi:MAG: SDR family oxidoreductase [Cytophagales bacterium]|nr:SDR family oxidoreductase [Cytophagales bacterium]MDW8384387.1 SDR family oxidoreductase [Flammeovirgaceae bacterium]